jgi:hypothetical protein
MDLNVLLVEDEESDMKSYVRDFPALFQASSVTAKFHCAETFEKAYELIDLPHVRFDLILSDTFRGNQKNRDAAVIEMVNKYRKGRFCPLVVFSASAKPDNLKLGAFVIWADKAVVGDIESAIARVLATGIPQLARRLHDELDRTAGGFLWTFLEEHWDRLWATASSDPKVIERLIRKRAALQLAEVDPSADPPGPVSAIDGLEYYVYPPLKQKGYCLGHIIQKLNDPKDIRVVLTPHCHLEIQQGQAEPRAKHVLTVKTTRAEQVLGAEKIANAKNQQDAAKLKKLKTWATPPSGDFGKPEGRYWYLPAFLEIPHLYCDFQQLESLRYSSLDAEFKPIAVLMPPFAESLQACFLAYHGGVGIPNIRPESIRSLLD